jgi:putative membrane protein
MKQMPQYRRKIFGMDLIRDSHGIMLHTNQGETLMALIARWFLNALALMLVAYVYSGVQVTGITAALIAALVLGLVNALIRPVLILLTLPVTILTLGLFIFVINALMFWLVAEMVDGFKVSGFMAALLGSLMFSVITMLTSFLIPDGKKKS